jgi:hypothetical protein
MSDVAGTVRDWFQKKLPAEWFEGIEVLVDADEILVVGSLKDGEGAGPERIDRFREQTRQQRMEIADEAQGLFNRKVSWGAAAGTARKEFTRLALPVMTRLGIRERAVLDTLVAAGVARSRSHALAWCARLVADNEAEWLGKLREAYAEVEKVRLQGPVSMA